MLLYQHPRPPSEDVRPERAALEPRTYDERVRLDDAQRRFKRELASGCTLSACYITRQPIPQPHALEKPKPYRVVQTVLVKDGFPVASLSYRRDGRVGRVDWRAYHREWFQSELTDKYSATAEESQTK